MFDLASHQSRWNAGHCCVRRKINATHKIESLVQTFDGLGQSRNRNGKWSRTTEIVTRRKIAHIISKFNKSVFLLQSVYWFSTYFLHDIRLRTQMLVSLRSIRVAAVHCSSNWLFFFALLFVCHGCFCALCAIYTMAMDGLCSVPSGTKPYAIINNRQRVSKHTYIHQYPAIAPSTEATKIALGSI